MAKEVEKAIRKKKKYKNREEKICINNLVSCFKQKKSFDERGR